MNRKEEIQAHLEKMAEIVHAEIAENSGSITRIELCDRLGLKLQSYPQESKTQNETTWLCSILFRILQDQGLVGYEATSGNRVSYHTA